MSFLSLGSSLLFAAAVGFVVAALGSTPVPSTPRFGHRGEARQRALERSALFAATEPLMRWIAGVVAGIPFHAFRSHQQRELQRAGHCLGLTPDEYSALGILSALVLGVIAVPLARLTGNSAVLAIPAAGVGLVIPTLQIQEIIRQRAKEITRGLPHSIEVAAMCMGAGLDFVGALRLLSQPQNGERDALASELSVILEELELGRTRRDALLSFADRVPTQAVRDLVLAVVQAEQRGNPLASVLQIQGRMLNLRRSVAAEEAAARAGILMIFPMMLLLGCILLLLIGPLAAKGMGF
jgi:tight adherence protein C